LIQVNVKPIQQTTLPITVRTQLMINLAVIIDVPITGVVSPANCAILCAQDYLATGRCKAWDWFEDTCELASAQGLGATDTTRAQVNEALYGLMFYPVQTAGYMYSILNGAMISGVTATSTSACNTQSACEQLCTAANWPGAAPATVPTSPLPCTAWQWQLTTQQCSLYSGNAKFTPTAGYTSGRLQTQDKATFTLPCPNGYTAITGGITCPILLDSQNTNPGVIVLSGPIVNQTSGRSIGWQGVCDVSGTNVPDLSNPGNTLICEIYYNPAQISAECCL